MNKREQLWRELSALISTQRAALVDCERRNIDPQKDAALMQRMTQIADLESRIRMLDHAGDLDRLDAESNRSTRTGPHPLEMGSPMDGSEFRSADDFFRRLIYDPGSLSHLPQRTVTGSERRDMSMGVPAAGGVLVPPQYARELLSLDAETYAVRPRARVIAAGDPPDAETFMPALDYTAGRLAGVTVTWIAEAGAKPQTEPSFDLIRLAPKELAAHIVLTDKLLRNAATAGMAARELLRGAISATEESAFLVGDGVGKPLGIVNAPCRIQVPRTAPGAVGWADILALMSRLTTGSLGKRSTTWIASPTLIPSMLSLADATNAALVKPGATLEQAPPRSLYGIPITWSDHLPVLGNVGDLILADLAYYIIKDGSGPFIASDAGIVHFTTNRTIIKAFFNVDGQAWLTAPLTLRDGVTTVSPFVVLQ